MDHGSAAAVDKWVRKYRWRRTWPDDRDLDGKPLDDYIGFDGDQYIGRIFRDVQTTQKKQQWKWNGAYPKGYNVVIQPNSGWLPTAPEACRRVEEYWDQMKAQVAPQAFENAYLRARNGC